MPLTSGSGRGVISGNIREMMHAGYPQRQAVAASLSNARRHPYADGGIIGYADGGSPTGTGVSTILPSAVMSSPTGQQQVDRYSGMSVEQLRELASRMGGTPQGQVVQKILAQRQMMPDMNPQQGQQGGQQTAALFQVGQPMAGGQQGGQGPSPLNPAAIQPPMARGGVIGNFSPFAMHEAAKPGGVSHQSYMMPSAAGRGPTGGGGVLGKMPNPGTANVTGKMPGFAGGGTPMGLSSSEASPWWEHREASADVGGGSGFLHGTTGGRADMVNAAPLGGSYVIPADVISGLGEGNSLAGARIFDRATSTAPYGTPLPRGSHGRGPPAPPPIYNPHMDNQLYARGGEATGRTPIRVADGEFILSPDRVRAIGGGDLKKGHRILDRWVVQQRAKIVNKMKSLPGPVKT
jgi:hypothetical protein